MNGFALNIDDSFLKTLAEVDKQMANLLKKKTKFSKGIVESFQEISKSGVEPFVAKLKQTQNALQAISNVPIQGKASAKLKKLQSDASLCADNVNKLILAMQGLTTSADTQREWKKFDNVQRVNQLYSERIHYMQQLESIVRKGMTSELVNTTAVTSQIFTLQTKLQAIEVEIGKYNSNVRNLSKETINALTKGEADFTLAEEKELKKRIEARRKTSEEILKLENKLQEIVDKKNKLTNTAAYQRGDANAIRSYNDLIAREQDLQNKIITMRNNLGALLAEIERKYAAEGAAKEVAEIQAAEDKKFQIAKDRMAKQLAESQKYGNISSASAMRLLGLSGNATNVAQEQAAIDKLKQARNQLNKTDANYQQTLDALNKKIAEHEHNIKMATDATYRKAQADKATLQQNTTYQGAMAYSNQTKTINEQRQAIEYLKQARNNLDKSTMSKSEYEKKIKELTDEIKRQQNEIDKLIGKQGQLKDSHSKLMNTTDPLQRKLALLFSVSAIQGYVNKLVEVRGEFELQQKALGAIIQNTDEANRLWQKTVELAVVSPFRVKELVTYTKQLAAYRVETEKLHDTTKMLADVSSGLGVDMNRLILAYGQVKAANYLRGTELRQFSEAGINMLGELSKYFTEIENRAVSVADVFDRVSKRGVSFEDVDKVFKRITSESGIFYKMQEKQSETLKGQISNLHDSIDLMLNDIGRANEGVLKGSINLMKFMVENWQSIANIAVPALEALILGWGTYKGLVAINNIQTIAFLSNMQKHLKATIILLTRGTSSLQAFARMSNITPFGAWGAVIGIVSASLIKLGTTIHGHNKAISDINKKYDELTDKVYSVSSSFMDASKNKGIKEMRSKLQDLVDIAEREYNMEINVDVKGMSAKELKDKFSELRQQLIDVGAFSLQFEKQFENAKKWTMFDDIEEDFQDLGNSYANISQQILSSRARIVNMLTENEDNLNDKQREALDILKEGIRENETEIEYVKRLKGAYEAILSVNQEIRKDLLKRIELHGHVGAEAQRELNIFEKRMSSMGLSTDIWRPLFVSFNEDIKEAREEFNQFVSTISPDILAIDEKDRTMMVQVAVDEVAAKKEWSEFVETTVKGWLNEDFTLNLVINSKKAETQLQKWQESYNKKFGDNINTENVNESLYGFKSIENAATKQSEVIERLQGEWADLSKQIIAVTKAGENATKQGGMYEGVDVSLLEARRKEIEKQLDAFGADYEKKTRGQGKDWWSEMAKGIQNLREEFVDLNKTFDANESKQIAMEKHLGVLKEIIINLGDKGKSIDLGSLDFTTEQGTIDALTFLKKILPDSAKTAKVNIEKALSDITGQLRIDQKEFNDKKLIDQIEDMFSGYEMSIELQKLNIPPDLAKQLFNVDSLTLPELKDKVIDEFAESAKDGGNLLKDELNKSLLDIDWELVQALIGEDQMEEVRKRLEKISEMEDKEQMERLKKYSKYLVKAQSERVKIKLEEMRQLAEIENTFQLKENVAKSENIGMTDEEWISYQNILSSKKLVNNETLKEIGLSQELIDKIIAYNEQMKISKTLAMEGVRKDTQEEMDKAQFNAFKESFAYQMLFQDVEYYSKDTIKIIEDGLKKVRANLKHLGVSELKELTEFEKKLSNIKIDKNPFTELKDSLKDIRKLQEKGITPKTENAKILASEEEIERLQKTLNLINIIQQKGVDGFDFIDVTDTQQYNMLLGKTKEELSNIAKEAQGNIDKQKGIKAGAENNLGVYNKASRAAQAAFLKANNTVKQLSNAYDSLSTMLDSVGVNMEQSDNAVKNIGLGLVDLTMQFAMMVVQAQLMGVAIDAAMGPIGWAAAALTAVATIFTGIFGAHDKKREKQIKKEQELIESLQKAYEKLEEKIENAYNINTLESAKDQAESNLRAQIAARQKQIALEEDKKKTDTDKIQEYKDEIEELRETLKELEESRIQALGGFGSEEAYKSATEEFVSAWLDAYKEAGDGLSGLEEQFKEFFEDMVKNQLMMRGVDKFLDPFYKQFDDMFSDTSELGGKVSKKEVEAIKNMWQTISPELNEFMESLVESLGVASDLSSSTDELSGLQRGIQSVSEETAQVIEAYLNSIRFFVAEQTTYLSQIAASFGNTEIENPMVSELKTQTEMIRAIRDMFSSVIRNGHPTFGGAFIKVAL